MKAVIDTSLNDAYSSKKVHIAVMNPLKQFSIPQLGWYPLAIQVEMKFPYTRSFPLGQNLGLKSLDEV